MTNWVIRMLDPADDDRERVEATVRQALGAGYNVQSMTRLCRCGCRMNDHEECSLCGETRRVCECANRPQWTPANWVVRFTDFQERDREAAEAHVREALTGVGYGVLGMARPLTLNPEPLRIVKERTQWTP